MHMMLTRRRLTIVALLILCSLVLGACQAIYAKGELTVDDWSRGERVGQTALNDFPAMVTDDDRFVYLCWVGQHSPDESFALRFTILDSAGMVLTENDLDIATNSPAAVQMVIDPQGTLHLGWIDRQGNVRRLFYTRLNKDGQLLSRPRAISSPQAMVRSYALMAGPSGVEIIWSSLEGEQRGMFYTRLSLAGQVVAWNQRLRDRGYDPAVQVDRDGVLHIAWQEQPSFGERFLYYATLSGDEASLQAPYRLAVYPAPSGVLSRPPCLGLADEDVYVFWSLERRGGGMTPPSAESFYVTFPLGRPEQAGAPAQVHIPAFDEPTYSSAETLFNVHQLADPAMGYFAAPFVYMPSAVAGQRDELAVSFAVQLQGRTTELVQVVLTIWQQGAMQGYQVIGKTRSISLKPELVADGNDDLHVVWIDTAGFGRYYAYYASTTPKMRQRLNRLTLSDLGLVAMDLLWGVVQAMSFLPLAIMWALVPIIILAIYIFAHPEGSFSYLSNRIMLLVAVLIYTFFKYALRSGWLLDMPLPRGLSFQVANVLLLVAPMIISGLAGLATWLIMRRRETSLLPTFCVFVALDAVVTLLIYIPGVLGE